MKNIFLPITYLALLIVFAVSCTCSTGSDRELTEREKERLRDEIEQAEEKIARAEKKLDRADYKLEEAERKIEEGMKDLGEGLSEAMSELTKELEDVNIDLNISTDEEVKDWNLEELEDYIPGRLLGMKRVSLDKGSGSFFNLGGSGLTAVYQDGSEKLELSIVDLGALGKLASQVMKNVNYTIESDSDNEKAESIEYKGQKAFRSFDEDAEDGNFIVFVGEQLIVSLESKNVSERRFKRAMDEVRIKDLARKNN